MSDLFFNKVTIIGVGLLGASFGLALKRYGLSNTICGYGRKEENLKRALEKGIIDNYGLDAAKVCMDSDLILLSTPVGTFKEIINKTRASIKKGAIVIDVGSVKGNLVYEIESLMPQGVFYVGSHPITGSERSGIDDARHELFNNALCIITPTEKTDKDSMERVIRLWKTFGMRVELMDPMRHDEVYGLISHLPHLMAYALVNIVGDIDSGYLEYAGQGFRDTTRIALSSPELWRDIAIHNRENLIKFLNILKNNLEKLGILLQSMDNKGIEEEFLRAQRLRKRLLENKSW